jgi:hypothetical protein
MIGLYGDRYDSRKALADGNYHSNIRAKASIIHIKLYKEWCQTGIAFEFGDQTYTEPNRTMMAYAEGTYMQIHVYIYTYLLLQLY